MHLTRRHALLAGGAALVAGATGLRPAPARAAEYTLKLGSNVPMAHPIYIRLKEASERVAADTKGQVALEIFPNNQLGSDTDMLSQVRSGALDLLTLPGVVLATLVPMASLNAVGFAFPDYPAVWKAMDGPLGAYIRAAITKANLLVLDKVWDNGFRQITSRNVPVDSPKVLDGMKLRVPVSPMLLSLFQSLGAAATSINFSELYASLQTGVVEGQENPLPIISTGKLYEVQKYCVMTNHVWDGYWLLGNRRALGGVPQELMAVVTRNLNEAAVAQRADSEKLAATLRADLTAKGLAFSDADPAPFRDKLKASGFYGQWKQKFGDDAWSTLEGSVGKLS